jgi:hypothetical protein
VWLSVPARRINGFVRSVEHAGESLRTTHIDELPTWTARLGDGQSFRPTAHRPSVPQQRGELRGVQV